jgi:hypothetical protein
MGGPGSGQWYRWNTKSTVEGYRSLDMRQWHREGLLRPLLRFVVTWRNQEGEEIASLGVTTLHDGVELSYRYNGDPQQYRIPVTWTPCPYGGRRPWFVCPNVSCRRRVAKLYLAGPTFRCRQCYGLIYPSQQEDRAYRSMRRAHKIQQQLGGALALPTPSLPNRRVCTGEPMTGGS